MTTPEFLDVHEEGRDGVRVFRPSGDVDLYTAPLLRERLRLVLDGPLGGDRRPRVVIDLSYVSFMDSVGLGVLISAYKTATKAGGALLVASAQPPVLRLFVITGMVKLMVEQRGVEFAVAELRTAG